MSVNINTRAVYLEKEFNFSDHFHYLQNEDDQICPRMGVKVQ